MLLLLAAAWAQPPDALAAELSTGCGNPYFVQEISFTFVVQTGDRELRRHTTWRPREGSVEVSWDTHTVLLSQIHPYIASTADKHLALQAYTMFLNDSYWLLAPCKVQDEGVQLAVDEQGRLALSFHEVGLTPGDRYWLEVEDGRVTAWEFTLESGRQGRYTWEDYGRYGPLELATTRRSEDGQTLIRFEDLQVR